MTDINKLIEQEAEKYAREEWCNEQVNYYCNRLGKKDSSLEQLITQGDFKAGANFILHQNRWRKVSDELPEVKKNTYFINVKKSGVRIDTITILSGIEDVKEYLEFHGVTEWKPIE